MADYVVYEGEDWSGLYEDGKLIYAGDGYLADERIREIFGVKTIQSDDWFLGHAHPDRSQVAQTLSEIDAYVAERDQRQNDAEELRAQARALLAQAEALENTN